MSIRILICLVLIFPIGSICFGQTISVLTLDTTIFTTEEWSEISKAQDGLIRSYADVHIKDLNGVPFSSREKELRIARLNEQQAQDSLSIARQRTWILALVGGLILAIGGSGFLVYRRRKLAQEQLADQKLSFQKKILDSTVEAQENERQRIAKDLHDGPVQCTLLEMGMIPAIDEMLNKTLGQMGITYRFDHYALDGQRFAKKYSDQFVSNLSGVGQ